MKKYIKTYKNYSNFLYLKIFWKKWAFFKKSYNVNYEIFEILFEILDGVYKIDKGFKKTFNYFYDFILYDELI